MAPSRTCGEICLADADVSDYLTCQKGNVSTTTLIAAGIGVTVGILLLVGVCVWLCRRQQNARYPSKTAPNDLEDTAAAKPDPPRTYDSDETDEEVEQPSVAELKRKPRPPDDGTPPLPTKGEGIIKSRPHPRAARVDSASSSSDVSFLTPPPPHPAHMPPLSLPSALSGSPVEHDPPRQLYPTPSPAPRHLRSSMHSNRQSIASTRTCRVDETVVPPMPTAPVRSGTAPLNIRKSTFDATAQPSRRPSGAIPSYYEATQGQSNSRPVSRAARPTMSAYGQGSSAPDAPPPVPLAGRPLVDGRRPSASAPHAQRKESEGPRRGSAERGGMI